MTLNNLLTTIKLRRGFVLNQLFSDLEKIQQQLLNFQSLKDISNRLNKAIDYANQTLGIHVQIDHVPANHSLFITRNQ